MAAPRRAPLAGALLAVLSFLSLLCINLWTTLPRANSASSVVPSEVSDRVLREGRARVIAELRLPGAHVAEGLLTPSAQSQQRRDIANARLQVLTRLVGRSHSVLHQYNTVPLVALEVGPDALRELEASSFWVKRVILDTLNAPSLPQSVPLIGADQAWSRGYDGTGVMVAIADTGVEGTHPFLAGKVVEEACYSSNVAGHSVTMCPNGLTQQTGPGAGVSCPLLDCWHGTHVAGIAAGNGAGAGVPFSGVAKGAQIMSVMVFSKFTNSTDCGGSAPCALAWTSDIIAGLERVYALRGVRNFSSANLSLGDGSANTVPCDGDPTKPIIDNLRSVGIATAIAAGNSGFTNALSAPACISSAVSVGATTKSDVIASYSNIASHLSLLAPGGGLGAPPAPIYSSVTGGAFGYASGTSMAAPHVTGAWAVLRQAAPSASVGQVLSALQSTGVPVSETSGGVTITKPRIQVNLALAVLVPTVSSVAPNQGAQGATVPVTINGSGFVAGATASLGAGITVSQLNVVSAAQLTATLTISNTAALGTRDVSVTIPGGGTGTLVGGFTVMKAGAVTLVVTGNPGNGPYAVEAQTTLPGALTVKFVVDGTLFHQESVAKYCLFGGDATCATGTRGAGTHVIKAQVLAQGTTTVLAETQITVTEGSPPVTLVVTGNPGSGPYAVEAQTTLPGALTVKFFVGGNLYHQESVAKYCLFGGDATCATGTLGAGAHVIKAQVLAQGTTTVLAETQITVTEGSPPVTLVVTGNPGSGPYAVEAQTTLPGALTVKFVVDGSLFHQESVAKYCLFGGDATCATGTLGAGAHVIKAQVLAQGMTTVLAETQITVTE